MSPAHAQTSASTSWGHRLVVALVLLGLVCVVPLWVYESRSHLPRQSAAPTVAAAGGLDANALRVGAYSGTIPVLTYHDISDAAGDYAVSPADFAAQMSALDAAGFHTVTIEQVEKFVRGQATSLPSRPILLTFDDGFATTWLNADPILKQHHFNALSFVITSRVVSGYKAAQYLDEEEMKAMVRSGRWEFGSHTSNLHYRVTTSDGELPALTALASGESFEQWQARTRADLDASQAFLRRITGRNATSFAFPYGAVTTETNDARIPTAVFSLVRQAGFDAAFLSGDIRATNGVELVGVEAGQDPVSLPRLGVVKGESPAELLAAVGDVLPAAVTASTALAGMSSTEGRCHVAGTSITVTPTRQYATCLGDAATSLWRNYTVSVDLTSLPAGCTAELSVHEAHTVVREGRTQIAVSHSQVTLRSDTKKRKAVLATKALTGSASRLSVTVAGTTVTASVGGVQVTASDAANPTGGLAFTASCQKAGQTVAFSHLSLAQGASQ